MEEGARSAVSVERAARNQVTFREANAKIEQRRRELRVDGERVPFLCECADERCTAIVLVGLGDYQLARESPRRFLIAPAHDDSPVIASGDGFAIIEKDGQEGDRVEELQS